MIKELKRCPFCKGEATLTDNVSVALTNDYVEHNSKVVCSNCGVTMEKYWREPTNSNAGVFIGEDIYQSWNKRERSGAWIVKQPSELPFPIAMFSMHVFECSECRKLQMDSKQSIQENGYYNFCPNCGCHMMPPKEE